MMKLVFDNGEEYELVQINDSKFVIGTENPIPIRHEVIFEQSKGTYTQRRYEAIKLAGELYGLKPIKKVEKEKEKTTNE